MELREVKTLIKGNHEKFGGNDYVRGRISGIGLMLLKGERPFEKTDKGTVMVHKCTVNEYDEFMNLIEDLYPGLCKFNYQG